MRRSRIMRDKTGDIKKRQDIAPTKGGIASYLIHIPKRLVDVTFGRISPC